VNRYPDGKKILLYAKVGATLVRLRQGRGVTIDQVCKALDMTRGALQKLEEGTTCPLYAVAALADFYGVSIAEVVPSMRELAAA
jgi:transcriptional regulator with XRE-family HTH domain